MTRAAERERGRERGRGKTVGYLVDKLTGAQTLTHTQPK